MKVVQINATCGKGSTGKIAVDISKILNKKNIENYIFYTGKKSNYENGICYAGEKYLKLQALKTRMYGNYGFNSKHATKKLITHLKNIDPDIVHLHNIHGHNVNLPLLFKYLKYADKQVIWTFHDCWSFTGMCTYFDYAKCDKWKTQCGSCPQNNMSWFCDRAGYMHSEKKLLFTGLNKLTIVTPSKWLARLVKESFLKEYPVTVINNGIDLEVFKPMPSNFRKRHGLEDKKIILGVAMGFGKRKGFDYFIQLADKLDHSSRIVLVGVTKEQIAGLPSNVLGIERTADQKELAEIYTAADVFVNCTLEDNFPTVNLEALACGTPVITFKTGGSVECIDKNIGAVVPQGNVQEMIKRINEIQADEKIGQQCVEKARRYYDKDKCFKEYMELYDNLRDA